MADNHTSGSGGPGYRYSSNKSGSNTPKKNNEWIWWVAMGFCWMSGLWPVALILLFRNLRHLFGKVKQSGSGTAGRTAYNFSTKTTSGKKTQKRKNTDKERKSTALIVFGSIWTAIFGLGTMGVLAEFLESLFMGYFFSDELIGVFVCMIFTLGGLFGMYKGVSGKRTRERYTGYLAYIGANREVNLAHMAAAFDVPVQKLCKDLRKMLADGVLPTGYLDLAEGKLFLTEMGYRAPEPKTEAKAESKVQEVDILKQIRQVNDDIPDEVMSAKIDRIEELTRKILDYQKTQPEEDGQLRSFLNYYLPTTLKLLRAYAQLDAQGIEGENISAAKARIEGMMDQVVTGFEKQLDKLFQADAMDINADVQVLENMLKKDGLSGDQMTMTL